MKWSLMREISSGSLNNSNKQMSSVFFWMTSLMYSRELLIQLRRLLTWYFTVRVGVRRRPRRQSRFFSVYRAVNNKKKHYSDESMHDLRLNEIEHASFFRVRPPFRIDVTRQKHTKTSAGYTQWLMIISARRSWGVSLVKYTYIYHIIFV